MASTAAMLVRHKIVLWARHGVMARSSLSVNHAVDRIAYAEVGAQYEVMNLQTGEAAAGLSPEEIRSICREFNIQQDYF
jgi:rhamnulose-1-phosphate aldolase